MFLSTDAAVVVLVVLGFFLALVTGCGLGANDVANSFGSSYGSGSLRMWQIIILAGICEFSGAILIGLKVSDTIRKGIIDVNDIQLAYGNTNDCMRPTYLNASLTNSTTVLNGTAVVLNCSEMVQMIGSVSTMAGCGAWLTFANIFKLPVSATHSVVGATIGYALVAMQGRGIKWPKLGEIVASWFLSPLFAGALSAFICFLIDKFILGSSKPFDVALVVTPFLYFVTVFFVLFSLLYKGSSLLHFDKIPLYWALIISFGGGIAVALAIWFLLVPAMKKKYSNVSRWSPCAVKNDQITLSTSKKVPVESEMEAEASASQQIHPSEATSTQFATGSKGDEVQTPRMSDTSTKSFVEDEGTKKLFGTLQIIAACNESFAHGGNDVSNAIAPLMSLWLIYTQGVLAASSIPPPWILVYGGAAMLIGLAAWGRRVLKTLGKDITEITPTSGFAIEFSSSFVVLLSTTRLGLPISTTHCQVGSTVAVGCKRDGVRSIKLRLILSIALCWIVTIPVPALISAAVFSLIRYVTFGTR